MRFDAAALHNASAIHSFQNSAGMAGSNTHPKLNLVPMTSTGNVMGFTSVDGCRFKRVFTPPAYKTSTFII